MTLTLSLIAGISLLFLGGHYLVEYAVRLAVRLKVSSLVIGSTIVAFGTSAPELLVSLDAVLTGHDDIVIGNIIGSNIANLLLVLSLSALIFPVTIERRTLGREGAVLLASTLLFAWFCLGGQLSRLEGVVLVAGLAAYTSLSFLAPPQAVAEPPATDPQAEHRSATASPGAGRALLLAAVVITGSLAALAAGSHLFVSGAVELGRLFGVSEAVIGLTVVAFGTAAPEIVTAAIAAWNRHSDMAIGNVIGSSIFNILGIAGVTALVSPVEASARFLGADMTILLAAGVGVIICGLAFGRLGRVAGGIMLIAYAGYLVQLG